MGLSCCVPGCNHKNGRELCSLYNFPNENDGPDWKQWYELWCERIGKSQRDSTGQSWVPTTWSRVCSCHFKEEERWKPRTRQPGLKFRAPVYFPFMSGASGSRTKSEPMNKTPLLAGLRVDTGMKSSLLAGLNVKIVSNDKASDTSSPQDSKPESPATSTPTNGQDNDVDMKEETRKEASKREIPDTSGTGAKKSKIKDEDVEMIEDDDDVAKEKQDVAPKSNAKIKTQDDDVQMIEEDGNPEEPNKGKSRWKDGGNKSSHDRLLKALTQPNSPAVQVIHTTSTSNSPVPMNMSSQSSGSSASAYSSLVQMNAKSQIPRKEVARDLFRELLSLSNRTVAPQSKYAELLAVIEDMGRDIRPTYSGSRTATERLKRGIVHARALVRECLAETERSARS